MTHKEKTREAWQRRFDEWKASGKTATAWCQEKGIYRAAFYHWKKRLTQKPFSHPFVEIKEEKSTDIQLEYQNIRIHLPQNFDSQTLIRCLEILKRLPC